MKFSAKIRDMGRTLAGSITITLESAHMDTAEALELSKLEMLDVDMKKHRGKRSRDANAYYWK